MPTFSFSGGAAAGGFNMSTWNVGFLLSLIGDVNTTVASNSSQVTYTNNFTAGGPSVLVATGSFSNFDAFGDPQSGTVTGFTYTTSYFVFGVPATMSASGISISVPNLYAWTLTNNSAALESALFSGGDTFTGTAFADVLFGYGGQDTLNGGDGDDRLLGGLGNDTLNAGDGNDLFVNDGGLSDTGVDAIDGGDGFDSIELVLMSGNVTFNAIRQRSQNQYQWRGNL